MKVLSTSTLLVFTGLFASKAHGISSISNGLQAASATGASILANPPLPMLYMKSGAQRFSIQPAYVEGKMDSLSEPNNGSTTFREVGKIYGAGGALGYSYAFTDTFGLYFLAVGSNVGGDFAYVPTDINANTLETKNIKSSFGAAGLGFTWTAIGGKPEDIFSLGLLGGPAISSFHLSQRVINTMTSSGTVTDDFEMETTISLPMVFVGLQLGIRLESFLINPYFVGFSSVDNKKCHDYKVKSVSVDGNLDGASTTECGGDGQGGGSTRNQINIIDGTEAFGVNVGYLPWHVAINVFSDSGEPKGLKGFKTTTVYLTLSFEL